MFKINKEKIDEFTNNLTKEFNERYILYLFDSFPLLIKSFNFNELFSIFEKKMGEYNDKVYILMEAEILLGEFFMSDTLLSNKITELMSLDFIDNELTRFLDEYKENVIGQKQVKLLEFLKNYDEVILQEIINNKLDFLEIFEVNDYDKMSILLGVDFNKNIYLRNLEL